MVAQAWNRSFFSTNPNWVPVVTVRAATVIGGRRLRSDRHCCPIAFALWREKGPSWFETPSPSVRGSTSSNASADTCGLGRAQ